MNGGNARIVARGSMSNSQTDLRDPDERRAEEVARSIIGEPYGVCFQGAPPYCRCAYCRLLRRGTDEIAAALRSVREDGQREIERLSVARDTAEAHVRETILEERQARSRLIELIRELAAEIDVPVQDVGLVRDAVIGDLRRLKQAEQEIATLRAQEQALLGVIRRLRDNLHYDPKNRVYSVPEIAWFAQPYMGKSLEQWLAAAVGGPPDPPQEQP